MVVQIPTESEDVLNPTLYNKLKEKFKTVNVYSRGELGEFNYERPSLFSKNTSTEVWAKNFRGGEHYATRCPFCGRRDKLWVSYNANSYMDQDGVRVLFSKKLVICFRCHFNDDPEKIDKFWSLLDNVEAKIVPGRVPKSSASFLDKNNDDVARCDIVYPKCVDILDEKVPDKVWEYLLKRGLDPEYLSKVFKVQYSEDKDVLVAGIPRIIFPIFHNGELIAWQGRALDDDIKGTRIPKYQFPKHAPIKYYLYNLDNARWADYGILVEGVTDVFKCGMAGIAPFGKTISPRQLKLMIDIFGSRGIIRIPDMDDPYAYDQAKEEAEKWNVANYFQKGVHIVTPPKGYDPGNLTHKQIQELIYNQTGIAIT